MRIWSHLRRSIVLATLAATAILASHMRFSGIPEAEARLGASAPGIDRADDEEPLPTEISVETELPDLFEAHNAIRAEHDLSPVTLDARLTAAVRVHALDMATHDFMAHEGSDDSTPAQRVARQEYPYRSVAENVARGYRTTEGVMDGWMNSPEHRANILGTFEQIGVAVARDASGEPFWAVAFATPWPKLDPEEASSDLANAINKVRTEAEKPPLKLDGRLSGIAQKRAEAMTKRGDLPREESQENDLARQITGSGYRFRRIALADVSGQPTAAEVVSSWQEAEESGVDVLGAFTEIGTGYAADDSGVPYWTVILGQSAPGR